MLTFVLQCVVTVVLLAFGGVAIAVGRRIRAAQPFPGAAWLLTGAAFTAHGLDKGAQNVWGGVVMAAGNESGVMRAYLAWAAALNHGRTFLLLGFCLAAFLLALRKNPPGRRFWAVAAALMAAGLAVGAAIGIAEGVFASPVHLGVVARLDVMELLVMLGALFALLLTGKADRHLWAALAAYAFSLALGIFWLAALSQWGVAGAWSPPAWSLQVLRLVFRVGMVAIAVHRLSLARRGVEVRGLMEPLRPTFSTFG